MTGTVHVMTLVPCESYLTVHVGQQVDSGVDPFHNCTRDPSPSQTAKVHKIQGMIQAALNFQADTQTGSGPGSFTSGVFPSYQIPSQRRFGTAPLYTVYYRGLKRAVLATVS